VPGIEFLGYLPDAQVAALLSRATGLVYPSRYEGFGLPVVEAMAAGTPALVSDIPVMREIAGDAAVRLPPDDVHAWADALERVSNDSGFRAGVVERATLRARDFSWEKTAGIVRSVLEKAAKTQSE
jgi:alpha-1,3-rhamnosyl/mannosyltransferase